MQRKNQRHCTGIIVYRFNTSINQYEIALMQSQKFRHHSTSELLWTIPGGKVEPEDVGENLEQRVVVCAKREVQEEYGCDITDVKYYPEFDRQKKGAEIGYRDPETMFYFYECTARPVSNAFQLGPEVERVQWFPINQLPEQMAEDVCDLLRVIVAHTEKYFVK